MSRQLSVEVIFLGLYKVTSDVNPFREPNIRKRVTKAIAPALSFILGNLNGASFQKDIILLLTHSNAYSILYTRLRVKTFFQKFLNIFYALFLDKISIQHTLVFSHFKWFKFKIFCIKKDLELSKSFKFLFSFNRNLKFTRNTLIKF